jgi:hypothetical protein
MTIRRAADVKSLMGTGIFLQMYSQITWTMWISDEKSQHLRRCCISAGQKSE